TRRNTQKRRARNERLTLKSKTWGTRDNYYRHIKIWCCYKCAYYSSSLFSSFLTKRGCLYGNPLALMANGFLQQSRPFDEQNLIFSPFHKLFLLISLLIC